MGGSRPAPAAPPPAPPPAPEPKESTLDAAAIRRKRTAEARAEEETTSAGSATGATKQLLGS